MKIYDQKHDFEDYDGPPDKIVCFYCIPRSGSNHLALQMAKTQMLGYPLEYFSAANIARLQARLTGFSITNIAPLLQKRTSPNGVFSFKWNANFGPLTKLGITPGFSVFVDRKDRDAQAKSFCIAEATGQWLAKKSKAITPSAAAIKDAKKRLSVVRDATLKMLPKDHVTLYYEDFENDTETTLNTIRTYIGEAVNENPGDSEIHVGSEF